MALHTHQTVDGETTYVKCYKSFQGGHSVVYVEIHEGYDSPGWAGGSARRSTYLRLTKEMLTDLSRDFAQLADDGEPDQSPQNASLRAAVRDMLKGDNAEGLQRERS